MDDRKEREMEYRLLGRSGLKVSVFTLGTGTFGGKGNAAVIGSVDVQGARRMIGMCLDAGVNMIDTANIYSDGVAEEITGEALQGGGRERILVATKVGQPVGRGPNDAGLSRHHIIAQCERSLRRLKTDYIDLYQMHVWDGQTPLEETLEAFDDLVRAGKVRYVGCSNFSGWHVMKALAASDRDHRARLVSHQIHYSLEARQAEYELVPISVDQGLGILVWGPLAGGWLSGKYRRNRPMPRATRHTQGWKEPPIYDEERLYDIIEAIVTVAEERKVSAAQVALTWVAGRTGVTSVIMGARTESQLADNLGAAKLELTAQERAQLDMVSAPPLIYPYWHQAWTARDRLGAADIAPLGTHV
jgi:aryl-alcohol dehydrogenase-like predicted oxidoreductase